MRTPFPTGTSSFRNEPKRRRVVLDNGPPASHRSILLPHPKNSPLRTRPFACIGNHSQVKYLALILALLSVQAEPLTYSDIDLPPHNYKTRPLNDRFTKLIPQLEANQISLDRSNEKAFLLSLLKLLEVPVSSQTLVFSTTSLQLSFISPRNPRAVYFTDDIYVGYIPGGRIEIVSLDPELGGIFYIFDIPRDDRRLRFERSNRCMNCHASDDTGYVPGLLIKSVIPGPTGGSLDAFRQRQSGHGIPFEDRFGGWHVTGKHNITNHWGNLTGRYIAGNITKITNNFGQNFSVDKYPVPTSDILPHLIHEHQVGFVNRVVEAAYRARTIQHLNPGAPTEEQTKELDDQARILVRYILFADEVPLPGPIEPDAAYKSDFLQNKRVSKNGASLKDLDLNTRLFKHRCSYMINTPVFDKLPSILKQRVQTQLQAALTNDPAYSYLPTEEKNAIRAILSETIN